MNQLETLAADAARNFRFIRPFVPMTHPACPDPGPDFVNMANLIDDNDSIVKWSGAKARVEKIGPRLEFLYYQALYERKFNLLVSYRTASVSATCLPGNLWKPDIRPGPQQKLDVMLLGKMPSTVDILNTKNFYGNVASEIEDLFDSAGIPKASYNQWYATTLIKHAHLDPMNKTIPTHWIRNWMPVLFQEMMLVRPRVIVCFGNEATKAVLDEKIAVKDSTNTTYEVTIPAYEEHPEYKAKVVALVNPYALRVAPEQRVFLEQGVRHLKNVLADKEQVTRRVNHDYRVVYYADELQAIVDEVKARSGPRPILVFDSEWDQQHPSKPGAYVRTIQFSDKANFGCCVVLREAGGRAVFEPSITDAITELRRLVRPEGEYKPRIAGHHLRADLPWIIQKIDGELGQLLMDGYRPAETVEKMRYEGGMDTMLIAHSLRETGFQEAFKLEYVCQALLGAPLWNKGIEKWKKEYCKQRGIRLKDLDGYGECPDEVLHPYACSDVAYPRELIDKAIVPGGWLDKDENGNESWTQLHTSMKSSLAFLEMEMAGLHVDMQRAEMLMQLYQAGAAKLLSEIREEARWPEFNPASSFDSKELLYGPSLSGRKSVSPRPEDALVLNLEPVKTSSKPPKEWSRLSAREREIYTPSTDKETLGILAATHDLPIVDKLRKYRFLSQVLKTTLKAPNEKATEADDVEYVYEEGLLSYVQANSRIYTSLFPTQETGRSSSVRPNLTNVSKRREKDYAICLGEAYKYPLRSIFTTTPKEKTNNGIPTVLVEFDLRGAELKVMAIQSGDETMIDHTERNNLPEDHPNYIDIHSNTAVKAFKLSCPPTKQGLASIGKKGLRDVAKTFAFGLPYGRGDEAIVRGCKEEGVETNLDEVRSLRDFFFGTYPKVRNYIEECQRRADNPRWLRNCFGRLRRFPFTSDRETLAKLRREAGNFPIQSTVADLVHNWMYILYNQPNRKDRNGLKFEMLLQIHDAILVQCRVDCLEWFVKQVIPTTLNEISIYRHNLDGVRISNKAHKMGTDITLYKHWGIDLSETEAQELGVPSNLLKVK